MRDVVVEKAPAKINLHLDIVARAPDGYHELRTIFQALELHDVVEAGFATETSLELEGDVDTGPLADNLVLRAARAFRDVVPGSPQARLRLAKRIPAGAGLGGGSSDAAATLRALNALAGSPLSAARLGAIAGTLGSDVPFFLCGSPRAYAEGRGERLIALPAPPAAHVVLVEPGFPVASPDAFAWWDARHPHAPPDARSEEVRGRAGDDYASLAAWARNEFEEVVFERYPQLGAIRRSLLETGAILALLSGSGSCVYGIFADRARGDTAGRLVRERFPAARVLHTRTAE